MNVTIPLEKLKETADLLWKANKSSDNWRLGQKAEEFDQMVLELEKRQLELDRKMWRIVDLLGWDKSKGETDIPVRKRFLVNKLTVTEIEQFRDWVMEKESNVYEALNSVVVGLGDDSFGDLCSEIVGRGKTFYESILAEPEKANQVDFEEKFSYCIPFEDGLELLNPEGLEKRILDFILKEEHYNPENWEIGDILEEERDLALSFYKDIVSIFENRDRIYSPDKLKDVCGNYDLYELYKISYKVHRYGFGNFIIAVREIGLVE